MRFPKFYSRKKQKMRDRLFGYMLILTVVILVIIAFGMTMLGTFTEPSDELLNRLTIQSKLLEREIESYSEELAVKSKTLSIGTSGIIERYISDEGIGFDDINGSDAHITTLQQRLLEFLEDEALKSSSSGAFIVLDATVNANAENSRYSRAGLYIQRAFNDDSLLLYRGSFAVGKGRNIMPHRKWQLEFDTRLFPDYEKIMSIDSAVPLEKSYGFTEPYFMPGTSEKVSLITIPVRDKNGSSIGICGFEVSESTFKHKFAQPTTLKRLTCVWAPYARSIDPYHALMCGSDDGYFLPVSEKLSVADSDGGLVQFRGESSSYIGIVKAIQHGRAEQHLIAVMIPKEDYDKTASANVLRIVSFLILLSSFAIMFCKILSKRFINPIVQGLEQIRLFEHGETVSTLSEMNDLFAFLAAKDREIETAYETLSDEMEKAQAELSRVQSEIERLAYSRKNEINPDDYENFVIGLKMLTKTERNIFEMYLEGKSGKEIIQILGIKESTLKFHNSNIYEKLGVSSRKQMLMYAALYMNENDGKIG